MRVAVIEHRWVAEGTLARIARHRSMIRDYEFLPETACEGLIYVTMSRLVLKSLA
jgi:hypothetical protein